MAGHSASRQSATFESVMIRFNLTSHNFASVVDHLIKPAAQFLDVAVGSSTGNVECAFQGFSREFNADHQGYELTDISDQHAPPSMTLRL